LFVGKWIFRVADPVDGSQALSQLSEDAKDDVVGEPRRPLLSSMHRRIVESFTVSPRI
jgi:hypothetical protein